MNAVNLQKSFPLLLGIDPMNLKVRSYDGKECFFQNCEFQAPRSGALWLGQGSTGTISE